MSKFFIRRGCRRQREAPLCSRCNMVYTGVRHQDVSCDEPFRIKSCLELLEETVLRVRSYENKVWTAGEATGRSRVVRTK